MDILIVLRNRNDIAEQRLLGSVIEEIRQIRNAFHQSTTVYYPVVLAVLPAESLPWVRPALPLGS